MFPSRSASKRAQQQPRRAPDPGWSPFRAAEKRFKARFPVPSLADVLDLVPDAGAHGRPDACACRALPHGAHTVPAVPGLVILPGFVPPARQRALVRWALADHARPPNETNLDTHYLLPPAGLWPAALADPDALVLPRPADPAAPPASGPRELAANTPASPETFAALAALPKPPPPPAPTAVPTRAAALLRKLRWANIGWHYHWGTKQYDFARGPVPVDPRIVDVCTDAVRAVDWAAVFADDAGDGWGDAGPDWMDWHETYEPDAGIVNFYQTNDTLMAHVDRSELHATAPLVSISLGCAAVFLIGGATRDTPPVPILLRSGDAVLMAGPACRRAYHGVPRVLAGTLPAHLADDADGAWRPYAEYLRGTRINVNVRQVFPRGFVPPAPPDSAAGRT